jgi:predicted nucleotidyltransferase
MIKDKYLENLLYNEHLKINETREKTRELLMNPNVNYDSFNLMSDLSFAVYNMVKKVYKFESEKIYGNFEPNNFAIFLYGSPSREEMTSYSDIDLHVIDEQHTPESHLLKENILKVLNTFGFGKIDDPNWENLKTIRQYTAKSITEGNQIIDAKYVCGDKLIDEKIQKIKNNYDTLERNVRNIFFQRFYLDHYYSNRSSKEIPNVKYCSGGYRELLTFDWFDKIMTLSNKSWLKEKVEEPKVLSAIKNLYLNNLVNKYEFNKIKKSIDFITLLRNEMLHVNIGTEDESITHLDSLTKNRLWNSSKDYFKSQGINNSNDISILFDKHSKIVRWTKDLMWKHIIAKETKDRGIKWRIALDEIQDLKTPDFRRLYLSKSEDKLLQIASVWGAHYLGNKNLFSNIAKDYVNNFNWEVQASLACSPLTPPDVLDQISSKSIKEIGLGYILRIIGRNSSTSKETLIKIANNKSLDDRYRKVAKLNLEKGLLIATTRAS